MVNCLNGVRDWTEFNVPLPHFIHNGWVCRRVFPGNQLCWYWQHIEPVNSRFCVVLFQSEDWVVKSANQSGAFLSWEPVCYTSKNRKVSSSIRVKSYGLQRYHFASDSFNSSGLLVAYFPSLDNRTHVRANNVSFGGPKDKQYYGVTQYAAWSDVCVLFLGICSHNCCFLGGRFFF